MMESKFQTKDWRKNQEWYNSGRKKSVKNTKEI